METVRNPSGRIVTISFDGNDTLSEIASVTRCTTDDLIGLMELLWHNNWSGGAVDWSDEE